MRLHQTFAEKHLDSDTCADFNIDHAVFNYATRDLGVEPYFLPRLSNDFVLLRPLGLLTRQDVDQPRGHDRADVPASRRRIGRGERRRSIGTWLADLGEPSAKQKREAAQATMTSSELIDLYIRLKEQTGETERRPSAPRRSLDGAAVCRGGPGTRSVTYWGGPSFSSVLGPRTTSPLSRVKYFSYIENQDGYGCQPQGVELLDGAGFALAFGLVWAGPTRREPRSQDGRGRSTLRPAMASC